MESRDNKNTLQIRIPNENDNNCSPDLLKHCVEHKAIFLMLNQYTVSVNLDSASEVSMKRDLTLF